VGQGVIDEQGEHALEVEPRDDEKGDAPREVAWRPGGALEEVVIAVQAVALGMVAGGIGMDGVGDAGEGVFAQTHDPAEQQVRPRGEGGLGEGGCEVIDEGLKGEYHGPHGGPPWLRVSQSQA
jgi:hypothetical protein